MHGSLSLVSNHPLWPMNIGQPTAAQMLHVPNTLKCSCWFCIRLDMPFLCSIPQRHDLCLSPGDGYQDTRRWSIPDMLICSAMSWLIS